MDFKAQQFVFHCNTNNKKKSREFSNSDSSFHSLPCLLQCGVEIIKLVKHLKPVTSLALPGDLALISEDRAAQ